MRRTVTILLCLLALTAPAVAVGGCGSTGHLIGGLAAHELANHFVHSAAGRRRVNQLFCLYHGHRVLVDLRTHHRIAAGLNGLAAYHACRAGFLRR